MYVYYFYFRNFYFHIIFHINRFFFQHMNGIILLTTGMHMGVTIAQISLPLSIFGAELCMPCGPVNLPSCGVGAAVLLLVVRVVVCVACVKFGWGHSFFLSAEEQVIGKFARACPS